MTDESNEHFKAEVMSRFGVLPNFFCTASDAPGLVEGLWSFAESAYLNSPLPSLFKERLFVSLSRFCRVRYCLVRHVGFLIGRGHPAGDTSAAPQTAEEIIALLTRPVPDAMALIAIFERLRTEHTVHSIPEPGSLAEADLMDALTVIYRQPEHSVRARDAVRTAVGNVMFETMAAYLAFIRTAHYWSETHPEIAYEPDILTMLEERKDLARLLLDPMQAEQWSEAGVWQQGLPETESLMRASEARYRLFVTTSSDVVYRMNSDWSEMRQLDGHGFLADTDNPDESWMDRYILREDWDAVRSAIDHAIRTRSLFELEHRVRRADGEIAWTLSRAVPILDESGEITEWLGTARDVTVRRRAEQALRDSEVGRRTRNLIAVTRSIFGRAMRESDTMASFESRFNERLEALAHMQGLPSRPD